MIIRTYRLGDEASQTAIYNAAAGPLPKFKPATVDEVARRCRAADFDAGSRFFAEVNGKTVGYATFHANGRVSYPWCLPGHEGAAEPLFQRVMETVAARKVPLAFAAYRGDWPGVEAFFSSHGFHKAREMVNYKLDLAHMPTLPRNRKATVTPVRPADLPVIVDIGKSVLRMGSQEDLERYLFHNPHFPPGALIAFRNREVDTPAAVGILVTNSSYSSANQVDPAMPCFRLGAFGTEGMQTKRINGLFSFMTRDHEGLPLAFDLMSHAAQDLEKAGGDTLAAQVPSDALHLVDFYNRYFQLQGSFPVFERRL